MQQRQGVKKGNYFFYNMEISNLISKQRRKERMKKADVVILGGMSGITVGMSCRKHYPDKSIVLVREQDTVLVPCAIPYVFGALGTLDKNVIPDSLLENNAIELVKAEATHVNREDKVVSLSDGQKLSYDKLVLATGSRPLIPPLPGIDKKNVFPVSKRGKYLSSMLQEIDKAKDIVIIGGGFIGMEFADECKKDRDVNVTVIEMLPRCLQLAMDDEYCEEAESALIDAGVDILANEKVVDILGDDFVTGVKLASGKEIKADVVILGIGSVPNTELAKEAGLELGFKNAIRVNRHMQTLSDPDIFSCGDCAEKFSFFDGSPNGTMLASVAISEARIAGANLFSRTHYNKGTISVFSTMINGRAFASAGISERYAGNAGCEIVIGKATAPDTHPAGMPDSKSMNLKLIFAKDTRVLLGGSVSGGKSAGEMINVISACILHRMTADDMEMFQMGTHPALTASPIAYPLVNAASQCVNVLRAA